MVKAALGLQKNSVSPEEKAVEVKAFNESARQQVEAASRLYFLMRRLSGRTWQETLALIGTEFQSTPSEKYRTQLGDLMSWLLYPTEPIPEEYRSIVLQMSDPPDLLIYKVVTHYLPKDRIVSVARKPISKFSVLKSEATVCDTYLRIFETTGSATHRENALRSALEAYSLVETNFEDAQLNPEERASIGFWMKQRSRIFNVLVAAAGWALITLPPTG